MRIRVARVGGHSQPTPDEGRAENVAEPGVLWSFAIIGAAARNDRYR